MWAWAWAWAWVWVCLARACLVSGERPVAQARREEGSAERVLADEAGRALEQLEGRARLELRDELGRGRRHAAAQRALQRRALAAVVRGQVAQAELARDAARLGAVRLALVLQQRRELVELGRGEHHHPVGGGHRAAAEALHQPARPRALAAAAATEEAF